MTDQNILIVAQRWHGFISRLSKDYNMSGYTLMLTPQEAYHLRHDLGVIQDAERKVMSQNINPELGDQARLAMASQGTAESMLQTGMMQSLAAATQEIERLHAIIAAREEKIRALQLAVAASEDYDLHSRPWSYETFALELLQALTTDNGALVTTFGECGICGNTIFTDSAGYIGEHKQTCAVSSAIRLLRKMERTEALSR